MESQQAGWCPLSSASRTPASPLLAVLWSGTTASPLSVGEGRWGAGRGLSFQAGKWGIGVCKESVSSF